MATHQEKEELIEVLKFTPRKYKVEITGSGGELYFGKVDRKVYEFFKEKKIDIDQYANSWDEELWTDIPSEMRPFEPGAAYDIGGVHESGATFDDGNYITVYDENGDEVWQSALGVDALEAAGVAFESVDEEYISEYPTGTVVFYGAQGEKGVFFGNEFELRAPFDPKKLTVSYGDYDGWELVGGVQYDGEEIDSFDYDTSGKWAEAKWIIAGDEEVYEGEDRSEDGWDEGTVDDMADHLEEMQSQINELTKDSDEDEE